MLNADLWQMIGEREQNEVINALSFPEEELRQLEASHAEIMALLKRHGLTDLTDHDAFFDVFYDENLRFDFMLAFKKFTKCLNLLFPAKEALTFMPDYQALNEINVLAGKHFRDARLSMKGIPPKLRAITDEYLESKGIEVKVKPISILDEDFQSHVGKRSRTKTKAAEVEHAIRHHLDVDLDDDPDLQASFAEALAAIFAEFRDNWNRIYEELEKLRKRIIGASKEPTYRRTIQRTRKSGSQAAPAHQGSTSNGPVGRRRFAPGPTLHRFTASERKAKLVSQTMLTAPEKTP